MLKSSWAVVLLAAMLALAGCGRSPVEETDEYKALQERFSALNEETIALRQELGELTAEHELLLEKEERVVTERRRMIEALGEGVWHMEVWMGGTEPVDRMPAEIWLMPEWVFGLEPSTAQPYIFVLADSEWEPAPPLCTGVVTHEGHLMIASVAYAPYDRQEFTANWMRGELSEDGLRIDFRDTVQPWGTGVVNFESRYMHDMPWRGANGHEYRLVRD